MHSIGDNFRSDVGISEHGTDHAGVAVGEWPHRIVNMYRMPRPSLNRRARLGVIGIRMAQSDDHTIGNCGGNQLECAGHFRRDRNELDQISRSRAELFEALH